MSRRRRLAAFWSVLLTGMSTSLWSAERATCAVLPFEGKSGISRDEADVVTERFAMEFGAVAGYQMISRTMARAALAELKLVESGCTSTDCAIEAGKILAARYMAFGSVARFGKLYTIQASVVDVETSALVRSAKAEGYTTLEEVLTVLAAVCAYRLAEAPLPRELQARATEVERRAATPTQSPPSIQPAKARPANTAAWHISPRVGASLATGLAGVEIQYRRLAVGGGYLEDGGCGSVRYYFAEPGSSWYLAACGAQQDENDTRKTAGVLCGYRYRSASRWELSLGVGVGVEESTPNYYSDWRVGSQSEGVPSGDTKPIPLFDIAIGYAF